MNSNETNELNKNIKIYEKHYHTKASEEYISVEFNYNSQIWKGWIPIVYRRTGLFLNNDRDIIKYLNIIYSELDQSNYPKWLLEQKQFWKTRSRAFVTKTFFDALKDGKWHCVNCELPKNPNWARRIQDLKELGYTISTNTSKYCSKCKSNKTHLMLLPIKRLTVEGNGYETWSPKLRKRIIKLLNSFDVYENRMNPACLPDHKFSEIRWDENTKSTNPDDMTDEEIKNKFQLLTNQRNQQKREVCRNCFQTGKRGIIYGIPFFYKGDENWDSSVPIKGKEAEKGCVGCGWYDIEKWREELIKYISEGDDN